MKKNDVFISYARTGRKKDIALELFERLTALGFIVWLDSKTEIGGKDYIEQIFHAISSSKVFIIMIDAETQNADHEFVKDELYKAYTDYKQNKDISILPILIDNGALVDDFAMLVGRFHYIKKTNFENSDDFYGSIENTLYILTGKYRDISIKRKRISNNYLFVIESGGQTFAEHQRIKDQMDLMSEFDELAFSKIDEMKSSEINLLGVGCVITG